jgi:hypothetical protein
MAEKLTLDEMLELVARIYRAEGTEEDAARDLGLFIANCTHPSSTDILFWPELVPELQGRVPTVEQVVTLAMGGHGA